MFLYCTSSYIPCDDLFQWVFIFSFVILQMAKENFRKFKKLADHQLSNGRGGTQIQVHLNPKPNFNSFSYLKKNGIANLVLFERDY